MKSLVPSRALARRALAMLQFAALVISGGIFVTVIGLALFVVPLTSDSSSIFDVYDAARTGLFIFGLLIIVAGFALVIRALTWKPENNLAKATGNVLSPILDDRFTFIRNINKRGLGYIDAVLIGPTGVLVFRITDKTGAFLNERGNWLKWNARKSDWDTNRPNWTQEVIDDIKSLKDYLQLKEFENVPVFGVVVFIPDDPAVKLTLKDPVIPATHLRSLYRRLQEGFLPPEGAPMNERINMRTVAALVDALYDR